MLTGQLSRFMHALWLRDACRDDTHVIACTGERQLNATMISSPHSILAKSLLLSADGDLPVKWDGEETMIGNSMSDSLFRGYFLRSYAEIVGKPLDSATVKESLLQKDSKWL